MEPEEYDRIRASEERHFWYRGMHALFVGALARAGLPPSARLLDAGCGTGGLLARLRRARPELATAGFDLSPLALRHACARGLPGLARASIGAPPFRDASFDAIVSADVLYHAAVVDDAAALAALARLLRPGGVVLLNLPAHPELRGAHDAVIHTARRYDRADVRRLAAAAGLVVERICGWNVALDPVARAVRRRSRGGPAKSDVELPPAPVNALLAAWLAFEAWLTLRVPLPGGLSLFAILRRPRDGYTPARDAADGREGSSARGPGAAPGAGT